MKRALISFGIVAFIVGAALTLTGSPVALGNRPLAAIGGLAAGSSQARPEPEGQLVETLLAIRDGQFDKALTEIDRVIERMPNFRLAHLIKGDLLMARGRPISDVGAAPDAPAEAIEDLRNEARVRLERYHKQRPQEQIPDSLLQLDPRQKYAIVVDTSKYTLYVFENRDGVPRYLTDYYATIGRNGIDKLREGDKKTPLGVYHVTRSMPRDELDRIYGANSALYGGGAFPINYPNAWDRRQGRKGHGIWLHGVPYDTYSRPPRASDGCVALTNEDFAAISRHVQVVLTPVIITSEINWVSPERNRGTRESLQQAIDQWRGDWESRDTERYLRHYSSEFRGGNLDYSAWADHKRQINAQKSWIKVKVSEVSMFLYPGNENLAVVTFNQNYASSNITNTMRKRQYWIRENGQWRILNEGAA